MSFLGAHRRLRKFFNTDLTDEIILREIIAENKLHNLSQLKTINREAAQTLIRLERRMELLSLGVVELAPEAAQELVRYRGDILLLNCIRELSPETAAALAGFRGGKLGLNGLRRISQAALEQFVGYKGALMLEALEELIIEDPREAEKNFRQLTLSRLAINGMKDPAITMLRLLARIPSPLELCGIRELTPAKAAVLIAHKGGELKLKGLQVLSAPLIDILVKYRGIIDISAIRRVEPEVMEALALHPPDRFLLHPRLRNEISELVKRKASEERVRLESLRRSVEEEEKKHREIREKAKALLSEFEKFDQWNLVEKQWEVQAAPEAEIASPAPERKTEAQLNLEISRNKNRLVQLLRKGPEAATPEEQAEIARLRKDIERLKEEIRILLELMVEEREVGALVFNSSDDLIRYLRETGAEADSEDALARMDDDSFDMFGGFEDGEITVDEDDVVSLLDEEEEELSGAVFGNDFTFSPVEEDRKY